MNYFDNVWKDVVVNNEAVTLVISRLRTALGDDSRDPRFIETIPKKGYRLKVDAVLVEDRDTSVRVPRWYYKSGWVWACVLAVALLIMSVMFSIVRHEYEKLGDSSESTTPLR